MYQSKKHSLRRSIGVWCSRRKNRNNKCRRSKDVPELNKMGTLLFFYRCQSPAPLDRRGTTQMSFFRFFTKRRRLIFCLEDQKWREHSARSCLCIRHRICRVGRCPDGKGWLRRFHGGRACIPSFTFSQPISTFIAFAYRRDLDNPPRSLYIGNRRKPNPAAFRWGPHRKCDIRHSWTP